MAAHNHTKSMANAFKMYNERERFSSAQVASRNEAFKEERIRAAKRLVGRGAGKDAEKSDSLDLSQYKPWYAKDSSTRDLKDVHKAELDPSLKRTVSKKSRFNKSSCQNCGCTGHKTIDCLDRPTKMKKKDITTTDRFLGYDPAEYAKVVEDFDEKKAAEKRAKQHHLLTSFITEPDPEQVRFPHSTVKYDRRQKVKQDEAEGKMRGAVESDDLRILLPTTSRRSRFETAKYLENLEDETVDYDPKTRSSTVTQDDDGLDFESTNDPNRVDQVFAWEDRAVVSSMTAEELEEIEQLEATTGVCL
ncbi:hypothetical protein GEMRC1_004087 [Eukaryota sp. GEM-RC1]